MLQTLKNDKRLSWLLPALILLLGAILRLAYLGTVPGGMHQDESFVAWNAFALVHEGMDSAGHVMPVYMADWGDGHSALYVWLLMPLVALNGGHVTPFLSRFPQALVSIFTLWAVYCLMKRLFHRNAGLIAMFLLAICPWHIMMSRWGLDANLAPGFLIFGFCFFLKALENEKYLLITAFFYGLCLYSYAVVWPIVPLILLLQIVYGLYFRKLRINKWSLGATCLLFFMALPLLLFILVNSELIPEITLPFMTIPQMGGYRGSELAFHPAEMWRNLRTTLSLLWHQKNGSPYDILLPYGLFYDIGRIFIVVGAVCLVWKVLRNLFRKEFCYEYFLFAQLVGGGVNCLLVSAILHQINSLYIPLVLCEAYGIMCLLRLLHRYKPLIARIAGTLLTALYLVCLIGFQKDYYGDYKALVGAYFAEGLEECVDYALAQSHATGIQTISAEKGAQWPRLLLYAETLPSQYLNTVEYDVAPAPASFVTGDGIRINTRIYDYDAITPDRIYIFYYNELDSFGEEFTLTQFYDWYVAVPVTP